MAANRAWLGTIGGAVPPAGDREPSQGDPGRAVAVLTAVPTLGLAVVSEGEMSVDRRADAEPAHPLAEMVVLDQRHEPRDVPRNGGAVLLLKQMVVEGLLGLEAASQGADEVPAVTGVLICGAARWIAVNSGPVAALPGGTRTDGIKAAGIGGRG